MRKGIFKKISTATMMMLVLACILCALVPGTKTQAAENLKKAKVKTACISLKEGGKKKKIKFKNLPKGATVTYSSSNKEVATVNKKGYVTPKGKGTCVIYCRLKYNGKSKKIKQYVSVNDDGKAVQVLNLTDITDYVGKNDLGYGYIRREVWLPEGCSSDLHTICVSESGINFATYFEAVKVVIGIYDRDNDYVERSVGMTRSLLTEMLENDGFSKKEIEYGIQECFKSPEEETKMLVDWAIYNHAWGRDSIAEYITENGADPQYIDYDYFDYQWGLKSYVMDLQSDIPTMTIEDVRKFSKEMGGFDDVTNVDRYFDWDIYNSNT